MAKKSDLQQVASSPSVVSIDSYINPSFMAMSPQDKKALDKEIDKLMARANHDLAQAPIRRNDNYEKHAVVETEKGGESQ